MMLWKFVGLGLFLVGSAHAEDYCQRAPFLVGSLERATHKNCADITQADLDSVHLLTLTFRGNDQLDADALDGLEFAGLTKLTISFDSGVSGVVFPAGFFRPLAGFSKLNNLYFYQVRGLEEATLAEIFESTPDVTDVTWAHSYTNTLHASTFGKLRGLQKLVFGLGSNMGGQGDFLKMEPAPFRELENLKTLEINTMCLNDESVATPGAFLDLFGGLVSLETLKFSDIYPQDSACGKGGVQLLTHPNVFRSLFNLRSLSFRFVQWGSPQQDLLPEFPEGSFRWMPNLETLSTAGFRYAGPAMPNGLFDGLENVRYQDVMVCTSQGCEKFSN